MLTRSVIAAVVALCLCGATAGLSRAAPVRIDAGLVDGTQEDGLSVYRGVPFAAPPVGDLRWRAPQPAASWSGVRAADKFAPACMQAPIGDAVIGYYDLPMSEDCLYVNVWTPGKSAGEHLPVMVWIYGGGFVAGSTSVPLYAGDRLAQKGVVVVSIAYRVGALGFLAHPELSAESGGHGSGNCGLLDQIAGLQWVKRNVAAFGGDPNRVTIFGESAGGISVSMLAASPAAKGLFEGVISESGGSFAPPKTGPELGENVIQLPVAERRGIAFLANLGATDIAEARKMPARAVVTGDGGALNGFWPALDGYVVTGDQYKLYRTGQYNDTPVLIGTNGDEGAIFAQSATPQGYAGFVRGGFGSYADKVLATYPPGATNDEARRSMRDVFREIAFAWPTWTWARLQSRTGKSKVFVYVFNHRPPYPQTPPYQTWGAAHGSELPYVFGHHDKPAFAWTAADDALSDQIETYWTNFAKTGDPNGAGLPAWPAFTEGDQRAMRFDGQTRAGDIPNPDKLQMWEGYYAWRRGEAPDPR